MRIAVSPARCPTTTTLFIGFVTDKIPTPSRIAREWLPTEARSHTRTGDLFSAFRADFWLTAVYFDCSQRSWATELNGLEQLVRWFGPDLAP